MTFAAASICRRFAVSTRGIAAVEFAIIMPILVILFLSTFDAANAIAIYMKVRSSTYVSAAVTNQFGTGSSAIGSTDMSNILGAASKVLAPYSSTPVIVTISQIKATSNTQATVSWSNSLNGSPLSGNYNLPTNFAKNSCNSTYPCYAILATVSYTFTPTFGSFITGSLNLSDSLLVTPRVSTCIQYNGTPSSC